MSGEMENLLRKCGNKKGRTNLPLCRNQISAYLEAADAAAEASAFFSFFAFFSAFGADASAEADAAGAEALAEAEAAGAVVWLAAKAEAANKLTTRAAIKVFILCPSN
jgi:hypothetical protein